jgi:hypothetical protein
VDKSSIEIPDWMPPRQWDDFVEMRRAKGQRAPFTLGAARGIIADLAKLKEAGHDPAAVLQASVNNGWSGVFPIKRQEGEVDPARWWESAQGIVDKGKELDVPEPEFREGPPFWAFTAKVWLAAGGEGPWLDEKTQAYGYYKRLRNEGVTHD